MNAIGQAVFHKDSKMMTAAIEFFLGTSEPVEESSDEEDNTQIVFRGNEFELFLI